MGERVIYDSGLQRHAKVATIIRNGEWRWPLANSNELLTLKESIPQEMIPQMDMETPSSGLLPPRGTLLRNQLGRQFADLFLQLLGAS